MKPKRKNPAIDEKEARKRRRERLIILLTVALIILLAYVESNVSWRGHVLPISDNVLIFGFININIILIILLIFLIVRNVVKLVFERRRGVIGSRWRAKLVAAFVSLSLIPTALLFVVSINFLSSSIENWFNVRLGDALNTTLEVAQYYYQQGTEYARYHARGISGEITDNRLYEPDKHSYLKALMERRQASLNLGVLEVHFDSKREEMIVRSTASETIPPSVLTAAQLEKVYAGQEVAEIESSTAAGEIIRGIAPVYTSLVPKEVIGYVTVSYVMPKTMVDKMAVISAASEQYRQLKILKNPVKFTYVITLSVVTLLILFSATWFGLFLAKGINEPIADLAEATRRIAAGDLDHQINSAGDDEIGVLGQSFNAMTRELKKSNQRLEEANEDLEERRKYMETVLGNVSAGVIAVDRDGSITAVNRAAERMLHLQTERILWKSYREFLTAEQLTMVRELLQEMKESPEGSIQKQMEIVVEGRAITILMTATDIRDDEGRDMGVVVVFEDLTEMQKAERAAAWREVARRMAHEIKNPLTPIQLSAQRLQRRYGDRLGEDGNVFQECTKTIIAQVDVLKNLVNAFSQYARMPVTNPSPNDLNAVITDPVVLFQDAHKDLQFDLDLDPEIPRLLIDAEQIKRVMVNLLDNAVAAVQNTAGHIAVRSAYDRQNSLVTVAVADNGCGVPPRYKMKIFEPYFSTKVSGTGLGLAIVSSIISDHLGEVRVADNAPCGTVVSFMLPVTEGDGSAAMKQPTLEAEHA
ncbi:MAG: HAMP domain-containing protein [Syntrophaceae bacterium]|nr:HAMP domain-containing protein [Syntrophaceae bacterium]